MAMANYKKCICCRAIIPVEADTCPNCLVTIASGDPDDIDFDYNAEDDL